MTARAQKGLAIAGALAVLTVFLGANAHLLSVALSSQPACAVIDTAAPARRAC